MRNWLERACGGRLGKWGDEHANGGRADGDHWIAKATENKGALHRELGVPQGTKIPHAKVAKAAHSDNPLLAKRARLAETLEGFHHS